MLQGGDNVKKLFMIGLGGSIKGANIEVHDTQLIAAESVEDCYEIAKERWYGDSLHLDSYTEIKCLDGYRVDFESVSDINLYMIVYGGYAKGIVDELHEYHFITAKSKEEAKKIGKEFLPMFPTMDHVDSVVDVFENVGFRFGLVEGDYLLEDCKTTHTFVKLK